MPITASGKERPARAGLLVFMVLVLTSSLLAAPAIAAEHDFGHRHPEGQAPHVHAVTAVVTGVVSAPTLTAPPELLPFAYLLQQAPSVVCPGVFDPARAIRAPPTPV